MVELHNKKPRQGRLQLGKVEIHPPQTDHQATGVRVFSTL